MAWRAFRCRSTRAHRGRSSSHRQLVPILPEAPRTKHATRSTGQYSRNVIVVRPAPPLARRLLAHARHFLVAPVSAVSLLLFYRSNGFLLGRPHRSLGDAHRFDRRLASGRPPNSRLPLVCTFVAARAGRLCGVIGACAFVFRMESDREGFI